jgi:hypothetical protein
MLAALVRWFASATIAPLSPISSPAPFAISTAGRTPTPITTTCASNARPLSEITRSPPVAAPLEGGHALAQHDFDAAPAQLVNHRSRNGRRACSSSCRRFDERRRPAPRAKGFGHLKADVARADDDGRARSRPVR